MEFLQLLAQYRTPAADLLFQGITYLAQEVFVVAVICWMFWCSDKRFAYSLGFTYFTSGLLVQGLKITFRIPRPWILDPGFQPVASALPGATGYSFPSGHTQSITALFGTIAMSLRKGFQKLLCFLVIFAVMFSRMYLGCHTPMDVCASFAVTMACVLINHCFFHIKDSLNGHEGLISVLMASACFLLTAYAVILERNGTISLSYAEDCLKASGAGTAFSVGYYIERRFIRFHAPETFRKKLLRLCIGLSAALLLQQGLKPILGTSLCASFIRYFITVAWILILYPWLFSRKRNVPEDSI